MAINLLYNNTEANISRYTVFCFETTTGLGHQLIVVIPCKHRLFNGRSMDVWVICSLDVLIYVLMSSSPIKHNKKVDIKAMDDGRTKN